MHFALTALIGTSKPLYCLCPIKCPTCETCRCYYWPCFDYWNIFFGRLCSSQGLWCVWGKRIPRQCAHLKPFFADPFPTKGSVVKTTSGWSPNASAQCLATTATHPVRTLPTSQIHITQCSLKTLPSASGDTIQCLIHITQCSVLTTTGIVIRCTLYSV